MSKLYRLNFAWIQAKMHQLLLQLLKQITTSTEYYLMQKYHYLTIISIIIISFNIQTRDLTHRYVMITLHSEAWEIRLSWTTAK